MTRIAVLVTACCLATSAVHAQSVSKVKGVTLMKACAGPSTLVCDAYVDGVRDTIEAEGKAAALACIPVATTGNELRDVLVHYLKNHPEDEHVDAANIFPKAFAKAYPCNK
jgi:hypothetical protein